MSKALFKVMSKSTGYVYNVYKVNNTFNLYKIYDYFVHEYQWLHVDNFIGIDSNLQNEIDRLTESLEKQRHFYLCKISKIQQENETLKAKLEIGKTCGFCPYYDYKSRCEKAIEYIDEHTLFVNGGIIKSILNGSDEK